MHRFEIICLTIHFYFFTRLLVEYPWLEKRWNLLGNRVDFEMNITDRSLELFMCNDTILMFDNYFRLNNLFNYIMIFDLE